MDLYEKYLSGEIPHNHIADDPFRNVFEDALCFQGNRIFNNLKKKFPEKTEDEILELMFKNETY